MNGNGLYFYVQIRSNKIEQEWTIFTVRELEGIIFTVCEQEGMRLWYVHFQDLMGNDSELMGMMGKYHSWPTMTDITCSHLKSMNSQEWDFLKQSCPTNLSSHPILSRPIHFLSNGNFAYAWSEQIYSVLLSNKASPSKNNTIIKPVTLKSSYFGLIVNCIHNF